MCPLSFNLHQPSPFTEAFNKLPHPNITSFLHRPFTGNQGVQNNMRAFKLIHIPNCAGSMRNISLALFLTMRSCGSSRCVSAKLCQPTLGHSRQGIQWHYPQQQNSVYSPHPRLYWRQLLCFSLLLPTH